MPFELKEGQGTLFKNNRKEKENHPDYTGELNVWGEVHDLSAWIKTAASGNKWMSISLRKKKASPGKSAPLSDMKDDVPW